MSSAGVETDQGSVPEMVKVSDDVRALHAELAAERDRATNLEIALASSRRIGIAIGIIMVERKLSDDDAFALLVRASQITNTKLRDVADSVAYTGVLDLAEPAG